jgi:CRISPR/Cas system-associated exonuclease Cas4 (RecB family)
MQQITHPTVRSSDLADHDFCALRFYLERVQGRRPRDARARDAARVAGTSRHAAHDTQVTAAHGIARIASRLSLFGAFALILMLILGLTGCSPDQIADTRGWLGAFGAGAIVLAILLQYGSAELRRRTRIPAHLRMLSSDAGLKAGQLLRDDRLGLVGRPDYVFSRRLRLRTRIFTAEVKSRSAPRRPFRGHLLQAAASIHLARQHYGRQAALSGYLVYADRSVDVELTPALSRDLRESVEQVRTVLSSTTPPPRNHSSPGRCRACPFAAECPSSLASST